MKTKETAVRLRLKDGAYRAELPVVPIYDICALLIALAEGDDAESEIVANAKELAAGLLPYVALDRSAEREDDGEGGNMA